MHPAEVEQRLIVTEQRSIRAEQTSIATAHGLTTLQVDLGTVLREVKAARGDIATGLRSIRDRLERLEKKQKREPNHESLSLTEEDWEDSPTGLHKTVKVSKAKYDRWREEAALDEDGRKWRALWKRARWFVWIVVGGAGALGGDRLLSFILKHL